MPGEVTWRGERLTETLSGRALTRFHCAASAQARRRTRSPMARIAPLSSATGMNSPGETSPRSGWFQRTSASTPMTAPPSSVTIGW